MKKIYFFITIIVLVICIAIWLFIINNKKSFSIPDNYIDKIEDHKSYIDGADIDYYIYSDKIVKVINNYYPVGQYSYTHEREILVYENLKQEDIHNYKSYTQENKGKIVLHTYE